MTRQDCYKISDRPVTSAKLAAVENEPEIAMLPAHYGKPLLLALARNPTTLFVCWSIDWKTAFADGAPPDRQVHLRLRFDGEEKIIGLEPMLGSYSVCDLAPGQTYAIELGYYAASSWRTIVAGNDVMLPAHETSSAAESLEVATISFHLSFEKMLELLRRKDRLAVELSQLQARAGAGEDRPTEDGALLQALNFSPHDLDQRITYLRRLGSPPPQRVWSNFASSASSFAA